MFIKWTDVPNEYAHWGKKHPEVNTRNQKQVFHSKQVFELLRESFSRTETLIPCCDTQGARLALFSSCARWPLDARTVSDQHGALVARNNLYRSPWANGTSAFVPLLWSVSSFLDKSLEDNTAHWSGQWPEHCSAESKHSHRPDPTECANPPNHSCSPYWQSQWASPALTVSVVNEPVFTSRWLFQHTGHGAGKGQSRGMWMQRSDVGLDAWVIPHLHYGGLSAVELATLSFVLSWLSNAALTSAWHCGKKI